MGEFKVGAGKAVINPPEELLPYGRIEAVKDDSHVRALVIDDGHTRFLLLDYEPGHPPSNAYKLELAEKYGFEYKNILVTSNHNHSTCEWGINEKQIPGMVMKITPEQKKKMNAKPIAFEKIVRDGTDKAIMEAIDGMKVARYGFAEGKSFINCNKDWKQPDGHYTEAMAWDGPIDRTLAVIKFVDTEDRPIAFWLNYPCQDSTAIGAKDIDGKVKATPGFPGYTMAFLEKRYKGAIAVWTCGTAGDVGAIFSASCFPRKYDPESGFSTVEKLPDGAAYMIQRTIGERHALDASGIIDSITVYKDDLSIKTSSTSVLMDGQTAPDGADMFKNHAKVCNTLAEKNPQLCDKKGIPFDNSRVKMNKGGKVKLDMQLAVIGDIAVVGFAGEPYVGIGLKCKEQSPVKNIVLIAPSSRDSAEFIVDDASAEHDSFQTYSRVYKGDNDTRILDGMNILFQTLEIKK